MTEFDNSYLTATVEVGTWCDVHANTVTLVGDDKVSLILIQTGQLRMYMDLATAASLADAIQSAVNNDAVPVGEYPPLKPLHC